MKNVIGLVEVPRERESDTNSYIVILISRSGDKNASLESYKSDTGV